MSGDPGHFTIIKLGLTMFILGVGTLTLKMPLCDTFSLSIFRFSFFLYLRLTNHLQILEQPSPWICLMLNPKSTQSAGSGTVRSPQNVPFSICDLEWSHSWKQLESQ